VNDFDRTPNRERESYGEKRGFALLAITAMMDLDGSGLPRASHDACATLSQRPPPPIQAMFEKPLPRAKLAGSQSAGLKLPN
jgi:hypothetical protein